MLYEIKNMTFARPMLLLLLIIPITLAFWRWFHKGQPLVLPFDYGHQRKGRWLGYIVNLANMLPYTLMVIALLLLAGPQKPAPPEEERVMSNIIFCVDVSGSMRSHYKSTIEAVKKFTTYKGREGDSFGLSFFGSDVLHWVPVTKDLEAINLASEFVTPNTVPSWFGGTHISKALLGCKEVLEKQEEGDRLIILLSDGVSSDLGRRTGELIKELKKANVIVDMIAVKGGLRPDTRRICTETGGFAIDIKNTESIDSVMEHVDRLHKAKFKDKEIVPMDFFEPIILLGLILLIPQLIALFGLRYTPW